MSLTFNLAEGLQHMNHARRMEAEWWIKAFKLQKKTKALKRLRSLEKDKKGLEEIAADVARVQEKYKK